MSSSVGTCTPAGYAFRGFALVLALVGVLFSAVGGADAEETLIPVTVSWTHPTSRTDGTPLDPALIMETRVWCANTGFPPDRFVPPSETSVVIDLPVGVHSCYAKTALTEKDSLGKILLSAASTAVEFTVEAPQPRDKARPDAPGKMKVTQVLTQ
jgi:hypothetical protein